MNLVKCACKTMYKYGKTVRTYHFSSFLNMDKFVVRYKTSDEALPLAWKTLPLPKSTPKKPIGRPEIRKLEKGDACSRAKRQCTEILPLSENLVDSCHSLSDICYEKQWQDVKKLLKLELSQKCSIPSQSALSQNNWHVIEKNIMELP